MSDPVISLRNVSKAYRLYESPSDAVKEALFGGVRHDLFWALKGINLDIHEGDRIGFVGPNGAGKSTLLKLVSGNLTPTTGSVTVDGKVSALLALTSFLNLEDTGLENVRFNLMVAGVPKRQIPEMTEEIVDFTELGAFIHAPVRTYSSGMTARLSFGISTAVTPDILIVDEILGAGDAYFAAKATMRMIELCAQGRALLFVSHAPSAIQLLCNRAAWIDGGAIRAVGDVNDIVSQYEADFRKQEDESVRSGNQSLRARKASTVLPEELAGPDFARVRLTAAGGRVTDTHYMRSARLQIGERSHDLGLSFEDLEDPETLGALDLIHSEWGRPHDRKGDATRTLAPSSRPLRGGHILVKRPREEAPLTLEIETTSIGGVERLTAQLADPVSGMWHDLETVESRDLASGWLKTTFAGTLGPPTDRSAHVAMLEQIVNESKPDVEIINTRLLVDDEEATRVREGVPFKIAVDIHAHKLVKAADIAIKIIRTDGYYVFWQSSGQVGSNLYDFEGRRRVTFVFDPNLIGAGDYEVTVETQNGFDIENNWPYSQVFDRRVNTLRFTVDRQWKLLMLGPINHQYPVVVESLDAEPSAYP